jgi:hypothetical protein
MHVYVSPTDAKHFRVSFYEMPTEQLHWLAAYLRSAREGKQFGKDPMATELLDRFDDAVRTLPKAARDAIQRPHGSSE